MPELKRIGRKRSLEVGAPSLSCYARWSSFPAAQGSTYGGLAEGVIRYNATEIGGLRCANPRYELNQSEGAEQE
jgi:hypothetical protein